MMSIRETLIELPIIGATYASRQAEVIYRQLRQELEKDSTIMLEVDDIMRGPCKEGDAEDLYKRRDFFSLPNDQEVFSILEVIGKVHDRMRISEHEEYLEKIEDCLGKKAPEYTPKYGHNHTFDGLRILLGEHLEGAEGALRQRTCRSYSLVRLVTDFFQRSVQQ